jgi:hypothetical protein
MLVNFARRPDQVRLAPPTRNALQRLARDPRISRIVISGRRRVGLLRYIGLRGIRLFQLAYASLVCYPLLVRRTRRPIYTSLVFCQVRSARRTLRWI